MQVIDYSCPICKTDLEFHSRYPTYVCSRCVEKASDESGRILSFSNAGMHGGLIAVYAETNECLDSKICYIDEVKCYADEAYMGGIIVQVVT